MFAKLPQTRMTNSTCVACLNNYISFCQHCKDKQWCNFPTWRSSACEISLFVNHGSKRAVQTCLFCAFCVQFVFLLLKSKVSPEKLLDISRVQGIRTAVKVTERQFTLDTETNFCLQREGEARGSLASFLALLLCDVVWSSSVGHLVNQHLRQQMTCGSKCSFRAFKLSFIRSLVHCYCKYVCNQTSRKTTI